MSLQHWRIGQVILTAKLRSVDPNSGGRGEM